MNRLGQVRKERGLSQLKLAMLTNIQPSLLSHLENGKIYPYAGWRKRLAEALGVTVEELFPEEELKGE